MKTIYLFASLIILTSCSSDRNDELSSINISSATTLQIKAANGENFLNIVDPNKTELYYENNGKLNLISYNWDTPKGYIVFQEPPIDEKMIKIFCYIEGNKTSDKTFIKWSNNDIDTISYNISRTINGEIINDIKYNSIRISINNQYGIFEIIK